MNLARRRPEYQRGPAMTTHIDHHYNQFRALVVLGLIAGVSALAPTTTRAAESYQVDPAHTSITFRIQHAGISWVQGRFNEFAGDFTIDPSDTGKSRFEMTINTASVDTNVAQRDQHLRTADFFDVEKYPEMVFKSTTVRKVDGGLEVTGNFTLHGVTKPVTFALSGGQKAEFPKGTRRIGFVTEFKLNRSDFGMAKMIPDVGDEVRVFIGLEGVEK
jgi:polyisoprenoid-binding protein YceI